MIALFALAEQEVTREQISTWLKKDEDADFVSCVDVVFASFLNGLIVEKRGKKEGPQPIPEKRLNNNIILTKLKIAFNLKAEEIIELLSQENLNVGKAELSAFFRKPDHKHYRLCKDQILRNFLQGLDSKFHVKRRAKVLVKKEAAENTDEVADKNNNRSYKKATPKVNKMYVNPNATKVEKPKAERKVLKLKPSDIWGEPK